MSEAIKEKILNGKSLTDDEIFDVIYGYVDGIEIVDEISGGEGRWEIYKTTVINIPEEGRYFSIGWGKGATEMQEDTLHENKFTEVVPKEVVKTIFVYK